MRWSAFDISTVPLDREALESRRRARLVMVLRVLVPLVGIGMVLVSTGLLIPDNSLGVGQQTVALLCLFGAYATSAWLAGRQRYDQARAALFTGWIAYLGWILGSFDPVPAPEGSEGLVLGVATALLSLTVLGVVALEHPERTGRWLVAALLAYLGTGSLSLARFERFDGALLWELSVVSGALLVGAGAMFARAFASDLHASIVHSELAMREAQTASEAKSRFLANMSHELRTPLTGIIGMVELLREVAADHGDDYLDEDLALVGSSAVHLTGVIGDVLDLSKIEAGRFVLAFEPFDLHGLVEQVTAASIALMRDGNNEMVLRTAELPAILHSDPGRLRQVLLNLLSNAAKFTRNGSVGLSVHGDDGGVSFEVWDTGIGIPDDKLELVFKPFEQVDGSTTRRHEGTGLGLAISRQIVAMLGGRLTACSRLGSGSAFQFTLPLQPPASPTRRAALAGTAEEA